MKDKRLHQSFSSAFRVRAAHWKTKANHHESNPHILPMEARAGSLKHQHLHEDPSRICGRGTYSLHQAIRKMPPLRSSASACGNEQADHGSLKKKAADPEGATTQAWRLSGKLSLHMGSARPQRLVNAPITEEVFLPQIDIAATEDKSFATYMQSFKERHSSASFYLYIHHYGEEIFYVGIGHGDRAKRTISYRSHGRKWKEVVRRKGRPLDSILRSGLTKEEASAAEKTLIAWYRNLGMTIVNEQGGGFIPSAESSSKGGWKLIKRAAMLKAGRME